MLQLLSWIDEISHLEPLDAQLDARGFNTDVDPRHGEKMSVVDGDFTLGDVGHVAAFFLSLCQSFRALLAWSDTLTTHERVS